MTRVTELESWSLSLSLIISLVGNPRKGIFYHQGTQVVEKGFNPTWVGAPQFYLYISLAQPNRTTPTRFAEGSLPSSGCGRDDVATDCERRCLANLISIQRTLGVRVENIERGLSRGGGGAQQDVVMTTLDVMPDGRAAGSYSDERLAK